MSSLPLVLASSSPRRRELLRLLNQPYDILSVDVDETPHGNENAAALVERLSRAKAAAALALRPDTTVIAADTVVDLDGRVLGKPRGATEAREMLVALRGRAHSVYGGLTVANAQTEQTQVIETSVWMRDYSDREINAYIDSGDPFDKAASYGVQHRQFMPVARVEGCFANVMGLSLCHLYSMLVARRAAAEPAIECHRHPDLDCSVPRLVAAGDVIGH